MPERRRTGLKWGGAALAVAAVAAVAVGINGRVHSENQLAEWTTERSIPTVAVISPTPVDADEALTLPASLQALNSAPIYARTSGYVREWFVDIGDPVQKGQILAQLDAPEVAQQLAAARAQLQTAQANFQLAKTTADRWRALVDREVVSRQAADERFANLAARTAAAEEARANVGRLQAMVDFTRIVAPFDGVVTSRNAQVGALIGADNASAGPLFTIADTSRIRAYVRVPQVYSSQVQPGTEVSLTLPEFPGQRFTANLTRTAGAVDPGSGSVLMEIQADNADRRLKPGAYAQANFAVKRAGGTFTLPPSALIISARGTQVAVVDAAGKVAMKDVTLGRNLGRVVEVAAGLTAADQVINNPSASLLSGDAVRLATAGS